MGHSEWWRRGGSNTWTMSNTWYLLQTVAITGFIPRSCTVDFSLWLLTSVTNWGKISSQKKDISSNINKMYSIEPMRHLLLPQIRPEKWWLSDLWSFTLRPSFIPSRFLSSWKEWTHLIVQKNIFKLRFNLNLISWRFLYGYKY